MSVAKIVRWWYSNEFKYKNPLLKIVITPNEIEDASSGYGFGYNAGFGNIENLELVASNDYRPSSGTNLKKYILQSTASPTTIPARCFQGCSNIRSVNIHPAVELIDHEAFADCDSLEIVHFPVNSSLKTISYNAFANSSYNSTHVPSISYLNLEDCHSLQSIGDYAFSAYAGGYSSIGNDIVTSLSFPASLQLIGYCAFKNWRALTSVVFASGSSMIIGHEAFNVHNGYGTSSLTSVTLPSGCQYYSDSFPSGCTVTGGTLIS